MSNTTNFTTADISADGLDYDAADAPELTPERRQAMIDWLIERLDRGIADIEAGRTTPMDTAMSEIRNELGVE